ncbi:hypothetical protein AaE_006640, partial [Aphanomyces astaci]
TENKVRRSELSEMTLEKLQKTWFITEKRIVGMMEISDRILHISPDLDGVFESYTLKPANDLVNERLGNLMFFDMTCGNSRDNSSRMLRRWDIPCIKKNIGIPDGVKLVVNYITLSFQAGRYANEPRSYFFSNVHDASITKIQQTVVFRVIKMSL